MRIVAIIQARVSSTRLPGKILLPLGEDNVLGHVVYRVRLAKKISDIVIATSVKSVDDSIAGFCLIREYACYRGSETDVLSRYYYAAKQFDADIIIRITSDCPLIDPVLLDEMIDCYLKAQPIDYLSNTFLRTYPRGLDIEIFNFSSLEKSYFNAKMAYEREHVTAYIQSNPREFKLENYKIDKNYSHYRWTLDTLEDYRFFLELSKHTNLLGNNMHDIIACLEDNQDLGLINHHVMQKSEIY